MAKQTYTEYEIRDKLRVAQRSARALFIFTPIAIIVGVGALFYRGQMDTVNQMQLNIIQWIGYGWFATAAITAIMLVSAVTEIGNHKRALASRA